MNTINTITVSKNVEKEVKNISRRLGISKEDFFTNAVLYYLQILKEKKELTNELDLWEQASTKDFLKFEKSL